ncbi:uncharacterized protein si:dkey-191g9.7 [Perca fluviatilis]|uniref:uncharacterized protein si:dkey-191g9.7 n=1 Tax=Perca fluviatilis TaxID=8168 RepID=UPI00196275AA|nr:uncharacterized protein si:dkey-191g9.7 [Perca fluviatilis]XP_039639585.1 uncharacterized protein si:dkey-191g9.7 [Perca fluviatilis]
MAEAGRPVSQLCPLGGAVSLESTLSGQSLFDTSKSSTEAATPTRLAGGPGNTSQEEPKEAVGGICKEHLASSATREAPCSSLRAGREPGKQEQPQSEHCEPQRVSSHPPSLPETHTPSHRHRTVVNANNDNPQAGGTVQSINPASLPVHRSPSDTLPLVKQGVAPQAAVSHTCRLAYHGGDNSIQEAESRSMLACKQPMQLQQCNIITTMCRGVSSGEGGVQPPQSRCVCVPLPMAAANVQDVVDKSHLPPKCDNKALCYGSYNHHVNFEDTFAAYCHPQPIPAPSQLLPRPAAAEPNWDGQHAAATPSVTNHLGLPRLISSVSETGLDAKHLLRCCNLNCSWISLLPPGAGPQSQKHFGGEECCSSPVGQVRTISRDMGTMTAHKELRDVGVQTGQTVTPHVFPQICLAEESRSETSCSQTSNTDSDGGKKPGGASKSPVKEVKWDAEGMTWEVYGASVDPEELGLAIQKHLELQIKETASHAAKLSRQDTNTTRQGGNIGWKTKRSRVMGSFRTPACCTRSTTAVD